MPDLEMQICPVMVDGIMCCEDGNCYGPNDRHDFAYFQCGDGHVVPVEESHVRVVPASLLEARAELDAEVSLVLEELATHDQCAEWPDKGGCHVAMQGMATRLLAKVQSFEASRVGVVPDE